MMEEKKKEEHFYSHLEKLIKTGDLKDALVEVKGKHIDSKKALSYIVAISHLAYNNIQKEEKFNTDPEVLLRLTETLCSFLNLEASNAPRFLTSLYHIQHFLSIKNYLNQATRLFKTIVKIKTSNEKVYEEKGKSLHQPFTSILSKTILKEVNCSDTNIDESNVTTLFLQLLNMLKTDRVLQNGTVYLKTVQHVCQAASKKDKKAAVHLITSGLKFFYEIEVENVGDIDSSLSMLFQIYANLFSYQLSFSSYSLALCTVDSHLNQEKWKFKDNINQGECFLILLNTVAIFKKDCPESSMLSKIKLNNGILVSFLHLTQDSDYILSACETMLSVINSSHTTVSEKRPSIPEICLEPFLNMLWNTFNVLKVYKTVITNLSLCLCQICVFIAESKSEYTVQVLKDVVPLILQVETEAIKLLKDLWTSEVIDSRTENSIVLILTRFANLIRRYHLASMNEEVIIISKPVCKVICEMPSDKFNTCKTKFQQLSDVCFTLLVHAFGVDRLDQALECLTMWLVHDSSASKTAFQLWADIKHNFVCEGKTDHLDDTLWTVISGRKSRLESDWLLCSLSNEEIGKLLFEELKIYFVNRSLRGTPVIAATNALLSLGGNCLLLVKGLVVGMDVSSVFAQYDDECKQYYRKSQSLIVKLRKEKKNIDPVEFNIWMGNLVYVQLRCQLKTLRANCETEMVRLSAGPREPLVAELPESRPDPNDTCDVATNFGNLCLAKQRKLFEDMDMAIKHWGFACSMMKESAGDCKITLSLVREAGSLMRLYCDEEKQIKAWLILYKLATLVGDVNMIVCAVAEMLNSSNGINKEWLDNAQRLLEEPNLSEQIRQMFVINSAVYCMKDNQVMEGLKLLASLEDNIKSSKIQYTSFLLTVGMYQKFYNVKEYNHTFKLSPSFHFSFYKALSYLIYFAGNKTWGTFWEVCQIHYQVLQVSKLLGETFWSLEQPREARCYIKSQLPLAQKLALPLRTVQLLLLLAWVDLSTGMADDCAVKMEGIEDLLELYGTPVRYGGGETMTTSLNTVLLSEPEYLSHPPACHCLPCTTVEYRRLVLETVTLRATFYMAFGDLSHAATCFQLAKRVQEDLSETKREDVLCSCARMWVRSAGLMISFGQLKEASSVNSKAEELLPLIMDSNIHQLVIEQQCKIKFETYQWLQSAPISSMIIIKDLETVHESQITPKKTPLISQKNFLTTRKKNPLSETNSNISPITPFLRPVTRLKIPSSGEENTPPLSQLKTKQKRKVAGLPKFVTETPQSIQKLTKISRKPFTFYHDNECPSPNTVTSTSKQSIKKSYTKSKDGSEKSTKKTLIPSSSTISNEKSDVKLNTQDIEVDDNIIRRSKRANNTAVKTYGKSKIPLKKGCQVSEVAQAKEDNTTGGKDAFLFNNMKTAISNVEESAQLKNESSTKLSSSLALPKKPSLADLCSSFSELNTEDHKDLSKKSDPKDDCDIVEGTPPDPPKKTFGLRSKKARSNKV